jgi:integrase/recombinase XerD
MTRAKQYADRFNVIKRIKLGSKWPFAPVVEDNGRIVRDHVWVAGRDEHHPEGRSYLEWYEAETGDRRRSSSALSESNLMPNARASQA